MKIHKTEHKIGKLSYKGRFQYAFVIYFYVKQKKEKR